MSSIVAGAGGTSTTLAMGEETILNSPAISLNNILLADKIARRNVRTVFLNNGYRFTTAEISLLSLLARNEMMQELKKSMFFTDKDLLNKVLKISVVLNVVTAQDGAYRVLE